MQKHSYLTPEAAYIDLEVQTLICISEITSSHEGYSVTDEEYNMFNQF